jgi:hypothetical protein
MDREGDSILTAEAFGSEPPGGLASGSRRRRHHRWFFVIGAVLVAGSIALLIAPATGSTNTLGGRGDCGVPLQTLFDEPGGRLCTRQGERRVEMSAVVAGIGVALLALSRVRRPLRFLGLVLVGASIYPMMWSIRPSAPLEGPGAGQTVVYACGTAIGDLTRKGYSQITYATGGEFGVAKACGDMAENRLYISLGIAGAGVLLLSFEAIRRRRRESLPV